MLSNQTSCNLSGNRLWLDQIERVPGLAAAKNSYITYNNLPSSALIRYHFEEDQQEYTLTPEEYQWTPAGITTTYLGKALVVQELKFITDSDEFASILLVKNQEECPRKLKLRADTLLTEQKRMSRALYNPSFIEYQNAGSHFLKMELTVDVRARNVLRAVVTPCVVYGSRQMTVTGSNDCFEAEIYIAAHETYEVAICGILSHTQSVEELQEDMEHLLARDLWTYPSSLYETWFHDYVPEFACSDPILEKLYYYHYYALKKNSITPAIAPFQHPCIYEGKDQFSLVCSASAAMHIRELRWMKKTDLLMAELHTLYDSQIRKGKTKGSLRDMYVSDIPTAVWETYLLLPAQQRDWIAARRTALKEYVDWERSDEYLPKKAPLPIVIGSWRTAAEYQPSFFEFTQPQWDHQKSNPFGAERDTQLHRVDDSVYLYTNLMAVSSLYQIAADPQTANIYGQAAQQIKDNILRYMYDPETDFFYDVSTTSLKKAVQSGNFAGFLGARIADSQDCAERVMNHLLHEFSTPYPIPTVATTCPAFSPDNTWITGPHANRENPFHYDCCWNGPCWNYSNSLVLDVLGKTARSSNSQAYTQLFADLFFKWCHEQCPDEDAVPSLCEHYHPYTGKPFRDVKDYLHSTFIDVIMRRILGICICDKGKLICRPLDISLQRLSIHGIPIRGHSIDIIWDSNKENKLQAFCDQKLVVSQKDFSEFEIYI